MHRDVEELQNRFCFIWASFKIPTRNEQKNHEFMKKFYTWNLGFFNILQWQLTGADQQTKEFEEMEGKRTLPGGGGPRL